MIKLHCICIDYNEIYGVINQKLFGIYINVNPHWIDHSDHLFANISSRNAQMRHIYIPTDASAQSDQHIGIHYL